MTKKIILLLLCVIGIFSICACGNGTDSGKNNQSNSDSADVGFIRSDPKNFSDTDLSVLIDGKTAMYAKYGFGGKEIALAAETIVNTTMPYAGTLERKKTEVNISFLKNPTSYRFSQILSVKNGADPNKLNEADIETLQSGVLSKCDTVDKGLSLAFDSAEAFSDSQMIVIVLHGYYSDNDYDYYIGIKF